MATINNSSVKPIDFYRLMAGGALKKGLGLKVRGQSIRNFAQFAMESPQISQALWKRLIETEPANAAEFILFPSKLVKNPNHLSKMHKIPPHKLLVETQFRGRKVTVLDLSKLDRLVPMLEPDGVKEEELQNLSVLAELGRLYFKHYLFLLRKGKAGREGDEVKKDLYDFNIEELTREMPWLISMLKGVRKPYRKDVVKQLEDVLKLHNDKNPSAANVSLLAAWTKLENATDNMEKARLSRRKKDKERVSRIINESVKNLKLEDFGIIRQHDGTWIIPQKGYRKYSDQIFVKEKIKHTVAKDDVLRRTQDIIQSITSEIERNSDYIRRLSVAAGIIKKHLENSKKDPNYRVKKGELKSIKSILFEPLDHYTNAIKRKKKTAASRLEITLGLIDAELYKQAISMINMAISDLEDRNIELSGQKAYFIKLGKVERNEITRLIKEEEDAKSKIRYLVRLFATWEIGHYKRMRGTVEWIEEEVLPLIANNPEPGFKNAEKCFREATKSLKRASYWSEGKPGWINAQLKNRNHTIDEKREIAQNNARNIIIKTAQFLIMAEWCIDHKHEEELDIKGFANLWRQLKESNSSFIEAIKKIK